MVVLELFSGTRSIGKAFEARGHEVYSVDYCEDFIADSHADIGCFGVSDALELTDGRRPDVIWASPDCTTYSVAALSRHRRKDAATGWLMPTTDYAKICDAVNQHLMRLIDALGPRGAKTGLQGTLGKKDRARIPDGLCEHIVDICEELELLKPARPGASCPGTPHAS